MRPPRGRREMPLKSYLNQLSYRNKKNLCTTSTYVIQIVFRRLLLNAMWAVVKTYHCNDLHIRTYILELITRSLRAKLEFKGTGLFAMLSRTFRFSRPVKCPGPGQRKEILSVRRSQVREYHLKISFRMFDTFWYIYVYIYIYCNILYYGFLPKNQSCLKRTEKEDNLHFFALWQSGLSLCFTPETVWWSLLRFAGRNSVPWRSFDQPCGAATNIDDLCL